MKFSTALLDLGFTLSTSDDSLFIKRTSCSFITLLVYVNDMIIVSDTMELVREKLQQGIIALFLVRSKYQVADCFTKPLSITAFI